MKPSALISQTDLLLLFGFALLIRTLTALPQHQPNYMDASYSYVNAINLSEGRGFVEDFVWNYLDTPPLPPHPSHLYWMPLTSLVAWSGINLFGLSYRAAQIPFILLSALLVPLTYWIAFILTQQRWTGWLAGLFMIFSGFYVPFWTAIDNFTPFALAGSSALLLAWLAINKLNTSQPSHLPISPSPHLLIPFLSGLSIGLAHLARADGPLLLITILLFLIPYTIHHTRYVIRLLLFLFVGYLTVMLPWFIRNWLVAGTILPVAGTKTIWLLTATDLFTSYNGLFAYQPNLSASTFFAQGWSAILAGRGWVLAANLQTVLAAWGMIFLAPLALIGGWHKRSHPLIQLAGLYMLLLFAAMTVVFAFPGALGGLFHSGAATLPFIYVLALIGLEVVIEWVARRRRHWGEPFVKRFFGSGLLLLAIGLSAFIYYNRVLKNDAWNRVDAHYPALATWIQNEDSTATVMINNPPAYQYHGGGLSVVVPAAEVEVLLEVIERYGVDYLVLEPNHPQPLSDLYNQSVTHPKLKLVQTFENIYVYEIIQP